MSAGEITELLSQDGVELSVRTVERVLAEEGFPRLPRRIRMKIGRTVKGAEIPERSAVVDLADLGRARLPCAGAVGLSSSILTKVHFDVALTMVADTLYTVLARKLRGFEDCDAPKLFRKFVRGKGDVTVRDGAVTVTYPKRAHNPILRRVPWDNLPMHLPGLGGAPLKLKFK